MEYHDGKNGLIMREFVGDVEENEYGVESLSRTFNSAPIVEFEDGSKVIFPWNWLINQAVEFKEKEDKK